MSEKLEILQCLIENRIFASSPSALAQELGYKGKMTLYRIIKDEVAEKTVNDVWEKLKAVYYLEDEDLFRIANICYTAKEFYDWIVPEMNVRHPQWVENVIISLIEEQYDYNSESFRKEVVPVLTDMKREEPNIFWGMVVLFYIRAKKIEPYVKDACAVRRNLLRELDEILFSLHPENVQAHQAAQNLMTTPHASFHIWRLLFDAILLFRYYTEANFIQKAVKNCVLFNWPRRSYWIVPGTSYHAGADVWLFVENNYYAATSGFYIALHLKAGKNIEEFNVIHVCLFQFLAGDEHTDCSILLTTQMVDQQKDICYYGYEYDTGQQELHFSCMQEWGNRHGLPDTLQYIDLLSPEGKEEKVWSRILDKFDKGGKGKEVYSKAIERFLGVTDLSEQYCLEDVIISRSFLSLILREGDESYTYQLPVSQYNFLSEINSSCKVMITRHESDGEVYVEWPSLGYAVKFSEFTRVK